MIEVHPLKVIRDGICSMTRAQLAASQIPFAVQDILLNERLFIGGNPTDAPRKYNGWFEKHKVRCATTVVAFCF